MVDKKSVNFDSDSVDEHVKHMFSLSSVASQFKFKYEVISIEGGAGVKDVTMFLIADDRIRNKIRDILNEALDSDEYVSKSDNILGE